MPIYTTTFPQDFWEHNFQQGGPWPPPGLPLESPMLEVATPNESVVSRLPPASISSTIIIFIIL